MQKTNPGGKRKGGGIPQRDTGIWHFSFQEALPPGCNLALNPAFGTFSYLASENGRLSMVAQEHFSNTEMSVLLPLLEMYPYFCPYEALHASFYRGHMTEEALEESRKRLDDALDGGRWDQEMRSIRDALSRTRIKLKRFRIDILSILATGYILNVSALPMSIRSHSPTSGELVSA